MPEKEIPSNLVKNEKLSLRQRVVLAASLVLLTGTCIIGAGLARRDVQAQDLYSPPTSTPAYFGYMPIILNGYPGADLSTFTPPAAAEVTQTARARQATTEALEWEIFGTPTLTPDASEIYRSPLPTGMP